MSQTDAHRLLEVLAARLPAAEGILITNRFGAELAENFSLAGHSLLPTLTAASLIFAGRLTKVTGCGAADYISLQVDGSRYSVFEVGDHWVVGILTPAGQEVEPMWASMAEAAVSIGAAPGL